MPHPDILERFMSYVRIDTQSCEGSETFPSTSKQVNLAIKLKKELEDLGIKDVIVNEWGYLLATVATNVKRPTPTIALIAHVDTSPDVSGTDVKPVIHCNYDGGDIVLNEAEGVVIKAAENPYLQGKTGRTIITSDGTTLLGADDKAGIAAIMDAITFLLSHPDVPRPTMRIVFTPDEETGRGVEHISVDDIKADYGYTVDGEKLGDIEDETFCAESLEIKIKGINVHPGQAKDKMVNAVKIAAAIVSALPKDRMSPETTEKREGYVHPYQISGGVEEVTLKMLNRDFTETGLEEKKAFLREAIASVQASYPRAKIEFKVIPSYRNMKVVLDQYPLVLQKAEEAVRQASLTPERSLIRGGTDGARLSFMGLPTPNLFTGGANFHAKTEWIALEDMQKASEVLVNLMRLWAAEKPPVKK